MNFSCSSASITGASATSPSQRQTPLHPHRKRRVPIIDTAKLLSLDLRPSEPIMNALLSPTSLDLRYRTKLRDVFVTSTGKQLRVNYPEKMEEEKQFQAHINELAEEAERVFRIGPIVLPDQDGDDGQPNPNRVGWMGRDDGDDDADHHHHNHEHLQRKQQSKRLATSSSHVRRAQLGNFEHGDVDRPGESSSTSSSSTTEGLGEKRSDMERAQLALVQRVRFVQPRSIAPSQLQDVIAATSSIAKSVDVDEGRLMLPSERAKKPSLQELLDQRQSMLQKIDADRPGYQAMLERSVELLRQQRQLTEDRMNSV